MLQAVLGVLAGPIARELREAYQARLEAQTDAARLQADLSIAQLQARRASLTQGRGAWISKTVQAAYALPFIIYNGKVVVWDKVLGWGVTDPLGPFETWLGQVVVSFYFLTIGAAAVTRHFAGR